MDNIKKAPSHPDVPRPSDAELIEIAGDLIHAIEACGASPALTHAVSLASDLCEYLSKPRVLFVGESDEQMRANVNEVKRRVKRSTDYVSANDYNIPVTHIVYALLETAAELCGRDHAEFFGEAFNEVFFSLYTAEEVDELAERVSEQVLNIDDSIAQQLIALGWVPPGKIQALPTNKPSAIILPFPKH